MPEDLEGTLITKHPRIFYPVTGIDYPFASSKFYKTKFFDMENNEIIKKEKRIVKSVEEATQVLKMLMQHSEKSNLENGITKLIQQLNNPRLYLLMDRYPELMQHYKLQELLSGRCNIPNEQADDVKTVGLFTCLYLLVEFCYELEQVPNIDEESLDSLRYVLCTIDLEQLIEELWRIILSMVGTAYYERFQLRIQDTKLNYEDLLRLEDDPELHEHFELVTWFALMRLFLEAVYTRYIITDHEYKICDL